MTEFSLSSKATCLMILHAAKYPHCCVSGILLGKKDKNDQVVNVVTVIPLFHRWHQLSAMAEVALMQINMMINESQQQIVGYYQANELLNDDSLDASALRFGEKILSYFNDAVVVLLKNSSLLNLSNAGCFKAFSWNGNSWKVKSPTQFYFDKVAKIQKVVEACFEAKLYRTLCDFDDHLENVEFDFTNSEIGDMIDSM